MTQGSNAFPCHFETGHGIAVEPGMSLRDYFAAQVLPTVLSIVGSDASGEFAKEIARTAYRMADAMIEARKK